MRDLGQQPPVLQQLHDDGIPEAEAAAGLLVAPEGAQKLVVAPAACHRPQLPLPVEGLEHDACTGCPAAFSPQREVRQL